MAGVAARTEGGRGRVDSEGKGQTPRNPGATSSILNKVMGPGRSFSFPTHGFRFCWRGRTRACPGHLSLKAAPCPWVSRHLLQAFGFRWPCCLVRRTTHSAQPQGPCPVQVWEGVSKAWAPSPGACDCAWLLFSPWGRQNDDPK